MTELQIGLIGLGGVAVFGVVVYNTWLEYRHRKLAQQLFKPSQSDVLLEETKSPAGKSQSSAELSDEEPQFAPRLEMPRVAGLTPDDSPAEPHAGVSSVRATPGERIEPVLHAEEEYLTQPEPVIVQIPDAPAEALVSAQEPEPVPEVVSIPQPRRASAPEAIPQAHLPPLEEYREIAEPLHLLSPAGPARVANQMALAALSNCHTVCQPGDLNDASLRPASAIPWPAPRREPCRERLGGSSGLPAMATRVTEVRIILFMGTPLRSCCRSVAACSVPSSR